MTSQYKQQIARAVLLNTIGLVAKLIHPLYFVVLTWLFGPELVGVYVLAYFAGQLATSAVSSGYNEATTIFASGLVENEKTRTELYKVLANGMMASLVLGAIVVAAAHLGADWLVARFYANKPELVPAFQILAWAVPLIAVSHVALGATKALIRMEDYVLIDGFVRPLSLLAFTLVAWGVGGDLLGLMWAYFASSAVVAILALAAFARHFSLPRLMGALVRFQFHREMAVFAFPQSLNMTFNRFLTRFDVLMLAAFGFSDHNVAFYATAALITSNLREIRLIFSTALAPVLARHHASGDRDSLQHEISRVSRWTTTLVVPLILLLVVYRRDLLLLVDVSYTNASLFMVVLLIGPFMNCALGLAGNAIVYTKHSTWNLLNSFLVSGLNVALNWILIPRYGLMGAAIATSASAVAVALIAVLELYLLEKVTIAWKSVYKPYLGLAASGLVVALFWDPGVDHGFLAKTGIALLLLATFATALVVTRHEEIMAWLRRR